MLPARYRMRRSADFGTTVKYGRRVVQRDMVIHLARPSGAGGQAPGSSGAPGPRVGLIIAKSVGSAVQRHRVARRLRHAVRDVLAELEPSGQLVIRALPGSRQAESACLQEQLRSGLERIRRQQGGTR